MRRMVYTVSSVNRYIRDLLSDDFILRDICVKGEVSNCSSRASGHIYFSLKDQGSSIACVMFAGSRDGLRFPLRDGMSVVVIGHVGVYERGGRYQLYADRILAQGRGALYEAYEALKKKLLAEGLFDQEHKKDIPRFPAVVGIVTSGSGAALHDIINVAKRRDPWIQLVLCPALVQGDGAARSIVSALRALAAYGVDAIIAGRGGGSIEDLWAFNEEEVARAVYECSVPVVSAVGHETDTTIIDYVSDLRAPTPSAAAELVVPDMRQFDAQIRKYRDLLDVRMSESLAFSRRQLSSYSLAVRQMDPGRRLMERRQRLQDARSRLDMLMEQKITGSRQQMGNTAQRLDMLISGSLEAAKSKTALYAQKLSGLSPLNQLTRGYAYVTDEEGHGISSIRQVREGQELTVAVTDGDIRARVDSVCEAKRRTQL